MMTDLELMELLDESGYEPCIENLQVLKEDENLINELIEGFHPFKAIKQYRSDSTNVRNAKGNLISAKGRAKKLRGKFEEKYKLKATKKNMNELDPEIYVRYEDAEKGISNSKKEVKDARNERSGNTARALVSGKLSESINASVEYSDYELYQMLDESGYKPTERNLSILKEGLESGKYEILDEGLHPLKAAQTYRFYTKNYVNPNKKNAKLAKEDPESTEENTNYWKNRLGAAKELRKTATRIALTDRIPEEKK